MNTIRKILNKVAEMHPYKVSGQHDTFSQYNEGWIDAIDQLEQELEEAGIIDKFNQPIKFPIICTDNRKNSNQ